MSNTMTTATNTRGISIDQCSCDMSAVAPSIKTGRSQATPLLSVAEAQASLRRMAQPLTGTEQVSLGCCQGRILASDIHAVMTVPPHDNSAMDGYALRLADLPADRIISISQRVPAGVQPTALSPGTAVRIFTGAPIPAGVDTVIAQEQVTLLDDQRIQLQHFPSLHQNIRRAGEDVRCGDPLLAAGVRLQAAEAGLLASQGLVELTVFKRLRVAILTTGNELVEPGTPLAPGQIYNSNAYSLQVALERLGCIVSQYDAVADTLLSTIAALEKASTDNDLVITSGGVSVGDEDHVKTAVKALGELSLWGVAMKPGKPFAFGRIGQTPLLGLPGNPMAALLTFEVLAIDFILRAMGARPITPVCFPVAAAFSNPRSHARQEYLRVSLQLDKQQQPIAILAGSQSSGVLSVATHASGYLIIPPHQTIIEGEHYGFVPGDQLYR